MAKFDNKKLDFKEIISVINNLFNPTLNSLYLEVTKRCLFNCVHCFNQGLPIKKEMGHNEICSILDQVADLGAYHLTLTGGEALLRTDFWKIIKYAKKKGFAIKLKTNAALITEEIAKKLADFYLSSVDVSIYGMSNKTYKLVTGVELFSRVRHAVEVMDKKRLPLTLVMSLFRYNFSDLPKFIRWSKGLYTTSNVISWMYHPPLKENKALIPFRYSLTESQAEQLIVRHPNSIRIIPRPDANTPLCFVLIKKLWICINAYGEVSPCISVKNSTNFRDKPIREIYFRDPLFVKFRKLTYKDIPKCRDCKILGYCTPCISDFFLYAGKLTVVNPSVKMCRKMRGWLLHRLHAAMIKRGISISSFSGCESCDEIGKKWFEEKRR